MPAGDTDPGDLRSDGSPRRSDSAAPPSGTTPAEGGERIAGYRLLRELGRGGMAVVYEAWDVQRNRRVALKILQPGLLGNPRAIARLAREAKALARLAHPGICTVYEAGLAGEVAYIAMQLLDGAPLGRASARSDCPIRSLGDLSEDEWMESLATRAIEERDLPKPQESARVPVGTALEVCEKVAIALHSAHEAGVVHRDIKPGNILVSKDWEPSIVDFGLAWDSDADTPNLTQSGDLVGTPSYAPPEQLRGEKHKVDRRSDIYSLGATLFEYITGRPPFEAPTRATLYHEILNSEPPDPRRLNPEVPRDLKVVIETALEKDPRRRYRTALELAEELRRVRLGQPIRARPPGPWVRTRRWGHRHPVLATAGLATFLGLVVALGASLALLRQRKADLLREQGLRLSAQAASTASTDPGRSLLLAIEGAARTPGALANNALLSALEALVEHKTLVGHSDEVGCARFSPDGKLVVTASKDDTARIWDAESGDLRVTLTGHGGNVYSANFSPDGRWVVTASADGTARVWEADTGRQANVLPGHEKPVEFACFGPAERVVVTTSADGTVRVWDLPEGSERSTLRGHDGPVTLATFAPGGSMLATASSNGTVIVWEYGSFTKLLEYEHDGEVRDASFSPDGRRIATASEDQTARVVEIATGAKLVLEGNEDTVRTVAFRPDGRRILTASGDNTARVWDAESGRQLLRVAHYDAVRAAAWSPDGRLLATASKDRTARIWDGTTGAELVRLSGHDGELRSAVFAPDGDLVLTSSFDGTARLWKTTPGRIPTLRGHADAVRRVEFSPDGLRVLTCSKDTTVRVWDAATGRQILVFDDHRDTVGGARFSPDGTRIVSWCKDGEGAVWDAGTGSVSFLVQGLDWEAPCASFSPDGRRLLTVEDGRVRLRDASSGSLSLDLPDGPRRAKFAVFSRDGRSALVVPTEPTSPWMLDLANGGETGRLDGHSSPVLAAVFSPSGDEVATASAAPDASVRIWDAGTCRQIRTLSGHEGDVEWVAFDPTGRLLATASRDDTARIWSVESGACLHVLRHSSGVHSAAFSPDGRHVVTASKDMTARVWDARTGLEHETLRHRDSVHYAAFSPDGQWVATASRDATARLWPVHPLDLARKLRTRETGPGVP